MEKDIKKKIEKIIGGISCQKDFKCYKSGFKNLCKAKDTGLNEYLDCLEENPRSCEFSLTFGFGNLCRCPLRVYIMKELNI